MKDNTEEVNILELKGVKIDKVKLKQSKVVELISPETVNGQDIERVTFYRPTVGDFMQWDNSDNDAERMFGLLSVITRIDIETIKGFDMLNFELLVGEATLFLDKKRMLSSLGTKQHDFQ